MNQVIHDDEIDLRELAEVIKRRLPFIILFIVLFTSLGVVLTLLKPPIYRARGELFVAYDRPSQIERITSLELMEQLKETLGEENFKGLDFKAESGRGASFISLSVGAPHPDLATEAVKIWIEN